VRRADLAKLERKYGAAAADNAEQHWPTTRGFKIANRRLGKKLRTARARVTRLFEQRRDVAKRVEVRDLSERALVKLATERKHLTDIIKMVAYQAESDLVALLRPHYARVDQEGRTLLHELFATAGDIRVSNSELHITLAPLSSPHRTHAAKALCEMLEPNRDNLPRFSPADAILSPPAATHRARLPRLAGPAQHPDGNVSDAETGHIVLCHVRRSEVI
jgi:transposase-like protein